MMCTRMSANLLLGTIFLYTLAHIQVFHLSLSANRKADISQKMVVERLKASAGANYDKDQNAFGA